MYRVKAVNFLSMDMDHDECVFWTLFNAVINSHTHTLSLNVCLIFPNMLQEGWFNLVLRLREVGAFFLIAKLRADMKLGMLKG